LWILHDYFGLFGCNDDLNVLDQSLLVVNLLQDLSNDINFIGNWIVHQCFYLFINVIIQDGWFWFKQYINHNMGSGTILQHVRIMCLEGCGTMLWGSLGQILNDFKSQ
jgi:hypothetical protein